MRFQPITSSYVPPLAVYSIARVYRRQRLTEGGAGSKGDDTSSMQLSRGGPPMLMWDFGEVAV